MHCIIAKDAIRASRPEFGWYPNGWTWDRRLQSATTADLTKPSGLAARRLAPPEVGGPGGEGLAEPTAVRPVRGTDPPVPAEGTGGRASAGADAVDGGDEVGHEDLDLDLGQVAVLADGGDGAADGSEGGAGADGGDLGTAEADALAD